MDKIFKQFIKLHGQFKLEAGLLNFNEFIDVYKTIEAITKIEIQEMREKHA